MKPIQLSWLLQVIEGNLIKGEEQVEGTICGISTDTRKIQLGDLFIPLRGERFDGHDFIEEAYKKGAIGCISERQDVQIPNGKWLFLVSDTKKAMMDLAEAYRKCFSIPVIGVTGSVGKTSTKDMIASILSQKGSILKTQGNYNNEIGVPLTIFGLQSAHQFAIVEMGMSGFGEIHNLSKIVRPQFAIITNIGVSHIEYLGSREGILKAKSEIFDYLAPNGVAIINGDEPLLRSLQETLSCSVITFGHKNTNMYWAQIKQYQDQGMQLLVYTPSNEFMLEVPCIGEHWIYNILPGVAIAELVGLSVEQIQRGVLYFVPSRMRMERESTAYPLHIINDTYNASLDSMKAAIKVLTHLSVPGRKVVILGDIFELGKYSQEIHRELGRYVAQKPIDSLLFVGEAAKEIAVGAQQMGKKSFYFKTKENLLDAISSLIQKDDTILIKASRGMHLEEVVEKLKEVK